MIQIKLYCIFRVSHQRNSKTSETPTTLQFNKEGENNRKPKSPIRVKME